MIAEIIAKGTEAMPQMISPDWDESVVVNLEEETFTLTFKDGKVSVAEQEKPDAESVIRLTAGRICEVIDGSADFMKVWMDLAEPSDTSAVMKGSGLKLATLLDLLSRAYKSNAAFKSLIDERKADLKVG